MQSAAAAVSVSEYLCNETAVPNQDFVEDVAFATAMVFAEATAQGSIECTIQGKGSVDVSLRAQAGARVEAWLHAYASAVAESEVCNECRAWAESYVEVVEQVSLAALSDVELNVNATNTDADGCDACIRCHSLLHSLLDLNHRYSPCFFYSLC